MRKHLVCLSRQKNVGLWTHVYLSFNGNKITTSGGGALGCNTLEQKNKTVFFSTQARENTPHYQHSEIGLQLQNEQCQLGLEEGQMEVLDKRVEAKKK